MSRLAILRHLLSGEIRSAGGSHRWCDEVQSHKPRDGNERAARSATETLAPRHLIMFDRAPRKLRGARQLRDSEDVEGIFLPINGEVKTWEGGSRDFARDVRDRFVRTYGLSAQSVPVVTYDLEAAENGLAPFEQIRV